MSAGCHHHHDTDDDYRLVPKSEQEAITRVSQTRAAQSRLSLRQQIHNTAKYTLQRLHPRYWHLLLLDLYSFFLYTAAFVHAGVSYLGMVELLLIIAATGVSIAFFGPATIPLVAGLVALVCGLEALSLEVPSSQKMILKIRRNLDKKIKVSNVKEFMRSIFAALPAWQFIVPIPALFFKLYYTYRYNKKSWEALLKKAGPKQKKYLEHIHEMSWLRAILGPFIKVLGPLGEGAMFWMGLIPFLALLGFASSATGGLLPIGIAICCFGFVMGATSNYALQTQNALDILDKGRHGLTSFVRQLFTFKVLGKNHTPIYYKSSNPSQKSTSVQKDDMVVFKNAQGESSLILLMGEKPLLNKDGSFVSITRAAYQDMLKHPTLDKKGRGILKDANGNVWMNQEDEPLLLKQVRPLLYKDGAPILNATKNPVLTEDGKLALVQLKPSATQKNALDYQGFYEQEAHDQKKKLPSHVHVLRKGFFSTILPPLFGFVIWPIGFIAAGGTAFLGITTISFAPWILPIAFLIIFVFGLQNALLDGNAAFELFQHVGEWVDNAIAHIQQAYRRNHRKFFSFGFWRDVLPNISEFIPDILLKAGCLLLLPFGYHNERLDKRSWLDVFTQLWTSILKFIVSLFGPVSHASEELRSSTPIFIFIVGVLAVSAATAIFPPGPATAVLALSIIAAVVAAAQNRGLEVTAAHDKIDEWGERFKRWCKGIQNAAPNNKLRAVAGMSVLQPVTPSTDNKLHVSEQRMLLQFSHFEPNALATFSGVEIAETPTNTHTKTLKKA